MSGLNKMSNSSVKHKFRMLMGIRLIIVFSEVAIYVLGKRSTKRINDGLAMSSTLSICCEQMYKLNVESYMHC